MHGNSFTYTHVCVCISKIGGETKTLTLAHAEESTNRWQIILTTNGKSSAGLIYKNIPFDWNWKFAVRIAIYFYCSQSEELLLPQPSSTSSFFPAKFAKLKFNETQHTIKQKKCVLGVSVLLERVCIMRGRCDAKLFTKWFISLVCVVFLVLFWKWTCSINNSVLFSTKEKLNQIFKLIKTQVPVYRAHDGDIKCGGTVLCCAVVVLLKVHNN